MQRQALTIILGEESQSYAKNLAKLDLPLLSERRLVLTKRFAVKTYLSDRHSQSCFSHNPKYGENSRVVKQPRVLLPRMSTARGYGAPFSFMGSLLNDMDDEEFLSYSPHTVDATKNFLLGLTDGSHFQASQDQPPTLS